MSWRWRQRCIMTGYVGVMTGRWRLRGRHGQFWGSSGNLVASADTGSTTLPVSITLCQTDPASGQCITPIQSSLTTSIAANATSDLRYFCHRDGEHLPGIRRTSVSSCASATPPAPPTRGSTSVAVTSGE